MLVTQNNLISGLLNGDLVVVKSLGIRIKRANFNFIEVQVEELFTKKVHNQMLIEDVLYANETNLTSEQFKSLLIDFHYRMKDKGISHKQGLYFDNMRKDPYLNALRAIYGYALTCHKGQGGEWNNVFLDFPPYFSKAQKPYVYQWLYTAVTRAKKELYLVDGFWIDGYDR